MRLEDNLLLDIVSLARFGREESAEFGFGLGAKVMKAGIESQREVASAQVRSFHAPSTATLL